MMLGAVQYKHWASSGFLPCSSMDVIGPCLHHFIMCQLIRAQRSCFTNGYSIYVYDRGPKTMGIPTWRMSGESRFLELEFIQHEAV